MTDSPEDDSLGSYIPRKKVDIMRRGDFLADETEIETNSDTGEGDLSNYKTVVAATELHS